MAVIFAQPIEQYPAHLAFASVPTVTNVDPAYPAAQLLNYDPTAVCRVTGDSSVITWDFGSAREFDCVSLLYSNVRHTGQILLETSSNGSVWTNVDAGPFWAHLAATPPGSWSGEINDPRRGALERNHSWWYSPTVVTARYVRLAVSDPGAAYMTFGRLFVGRSFASGSGMQYGSGFSFSDSGRKERTDQGALIMEAGRTIVTANVKTEFLSTDDMYDYVYEFEYWRGGCREMLACLDTEAAARLQKNLMYCTMSEGRTIVSDTWNCYSKTWNLESLA